MLNFIKILLPAPKKAWYLAPITFIGWVATKVGLRDAHPCGQPLKAFENLIGLLPEQIEYPLCRMEEKMGVSSLTALTLLTVGSIVTYKTLHNYNAHQKRLKEAEGKKPSEEIAPPLEVTLEDTIKHEIIDNLGIVGNIAQVGMNIGSWLLNDLTKQIMDKIYLNNAPDANKKLSAQERAEVALQVKLALNNANKPALKRVLTATAQEQAALVERAQKASTSALPGEQGGKLQRQVTFEKLGPELMRGYLQPKPMHSLALVKKEAVQKPEDTGTQPPAELKPVAPKPARVMVK